MPMFPVPNWTHADYHSGARRFGANRAGGRKHAGVDIYAPLYSPIYAIADGTVKLGPYAFYCATNAIEIVHEELDVVVRYGEVAQGKQAVKGLAHGTKVKQGDLIAHVGLLVGITVPSPMLHFEMYSIEAASPKESLSGAGIYRRSRYLINATAHVDALLNKAPTPMTAQPSQPQTAHASSPTPTQTTAPARPVPTQAHVNPAAVGGGGGPHTAVGGGGGPGQPAEAHASPTGPTSVGDDSLGTAGQYAAPEHRGSVAAVPLKMYFFLKG